MISLMRVAAIAAALSLSACNVSSGNQADNGAAPSAAGIAPILDAPEAVHTATYAKPLITRVHHDALHLNIDFNSKRVGGTATLDIDRKPDAREIILDDTLLEIASITDGDKQPLDYKVGAGDE